MQCVNCHAELIPGKQFCHVCGTRAANTCGHCGSTVDAGFRFCPECGNALEDVPAAPTTTRLGDRLADISRHIPSDLAAKIRASQGLIAGERKLVTVLFCDLVGSTAIAERLDPEEYRDLLEQYLEVVFREIYAVEGVVNQLAGDGVMALFGAPIAHEDAPYRAVHAALAVRDALHEARERLRSRGRDDLQVRIGIHTGPVVVGAVGNDLKMDYTAIGDTTNLAARLQTAAEPGMVLISEATQRLVRGFFRLKPGRRLEVKGKRDPVTAFEVIGPSDTTTPMAIAEARGLTPLVGRRNELAQLAACYERVQDRSTQIVAVGGDAGSGKSRLLYEFKQRLADEPAVFLEARCAAMTQSVPYAPWVSLLRDYFGLRRGEPATDACGKIRAKVATLDARLHDSWHVLCRLLSIPVAAASHVDLSENEAKRLTFETVGDLFRGIAEQAPLILVIEDLHWMDPPSREMLDLAVSQMGDDVEMVLVTHRREHQPFWRTRATFTQINLLPLSDDEARQIVRAVAGGSLPPELERGILAKAEGNPFFTEEITRALVEEGYLLRSDGRIRVTRPPSEMRLPGTVEEVIGARLDRLGPQAKRTVQVAAVLGRQFHRVQLEALVDAEEIDVPAALATLETHGIIHRKAVLAGDEFRFGESLTQAIAYESLLLRQRRELHARVGALLETGDGDPTPERSALIAHHFALSDDRAKAITTLLRAAEDAERIAAFPTATGFYRQAWDLASEMVAVDDGEATARQTLGAALGIARAIVLYGAANPEQDLLEITARGRELATRLHDDDALSRVLMLWGMALTSLGRERYDEGVRLIEEAHAIATRLDDPLAAVRTARALAWGAMFDGRFAEANQRMAEVVAELERHDPGGGSDVYVTALFIRDRIRLHGDDLAEAEAARATFEHARVKGNRTVQAGSATTLAMIHLLRAEYALAREHAERSLAIAEGTGNLAQVRPVAAMAILARHELGEPMVPRHLELLRSGPVVGAEPLLAPLVVEAFLALDEPATAKRYARSAIDSSGGRLRAAAVLLAHADAWRSLGPGHCAEIGDLYTRAADLAEALGARSIGAAVALGRGQLALARGEGTVALRHLEDARARFHAIGFQRYVTRAERLIGELPPAVQETA